MNRINFIPIIKGHLKTLRSLNQTKKGIYWVDGLVFFVIPMLISWYLAYLNISLKDIAGDLIKAIAIFAAFLFNLLAIIYNTIKELRQDSTISEIRKIYVDEIHSNISFNILTAVFLILFLVSYKLTKGEELLFKLAEGFQLWVVYFLMMLFILTLLMNLRRIYILMNTNE